MPQSNAVTVVRPGVQGAFASRESLLAGTIELEDQLAVEAAQSAADAGTFGAGLSPAATRQLQGICTTLVANPDDTAAIEALQQALGVYARQNPEAVTRFCLEPAISQLQGELASSRESIGRLDADSQAQANIDLQNILQKQQQTLAAISTVLGTKHDTAKNSISNVR
jgi:hypothetical protein